VRGLISKADEQGYVESALDTVYVWSKDRDMKSGLESVSHILGKVWRPTVSGPAVTITWQCYICKYLLLKNL